MTFKSYDKLGCNIKEVMDVIRRIAEKENDIYILKFEIEVKNAIPTPKTCLSQFMRN
jgi:hypothetical protein